MSRRGAQMLPLAALLLTDCTPFPSLAGLTGGHRDAADGSDASRDDAPCPAQPCLFEVFRTGQPVTAFVADDQHLYWSSGEAGTVTRMRHDGAGGPLPVASHQAAPRALALRAGLLYWTNEGVRLADGSDAFVRNSGAIMRARVDGSELGVLAGGQNRPTAIAFDDDVLYWANHGVAAVEAAPDGAIITCQLPGCDRVTSVLTNERSPTHLLAEGGTLIWTTLATPTEGFAGRLRRLRVANRAVQDLSSDALSPTTLAAIPGGAAFWWGDAVGRVHREPLAAGARTSWQVNGLPRSIAAAEADRAFVALGTSAASDAATARAALASIARTSDVVAETLLGRTATAVLVHDRRVYVAAAGDIFVAQF